MKNAYIKITPANGVPSLSLVFDSIKMTKNQNKIVFLLTGIGIGILCTIGVYKFKHFIDNFWSAKYSHASYNLRYKVEHVNIPLPKKAYNIDFYYDEGRDYVCWLAFSATSQEISEVTDYLKAQRPANWKYKPEPKPSKGKDGQILIDWWPENTKGFEIFYGLRCWMGYDKKNSRLYIYKFAT